MKADLKPNDLTPEVVLADASVFRNLWRSFGSAVALIATEYEGGRHSMLATAATSVSMDPPSLLVCVNRSASAYPALKARGAFSLGIMPSRSHVIGRAIATAASAERFLHGNWNRLAGTGETTDGLPWLAETQATLFCTIETSLDYGTHTIFVANVVHAIGNCSNDPLLYCDGRYGRFNEIAV
ncbi:flavin reductase family protein [Rhizobium sp. CF142]|uniref:flavin reductase family protein n=1 Tax=Rhizobium sp. CF142 TaxID=1144314 RepID=UPI00026EE93F|nr:flavin reductase family protein [Rhizobium sp. CF142]EJJ31469.1 DIM6/NTAB-family protein [Rhizobium sp. CF142]